MKQQTFENKNRFKDFDLGFSRSPLTNDLPKKTDTNAIQQSIKNLLNTNYYERPFRPKVGSNLRSLLFEPADFIITDELKSAIGEVLQNYEPRVSVRSIEVNDNPDKNAYNVLLVYTVVGSDTVKELSLTLKRLR